MVMEEKGTQNLLFTEPLTEFQGLTLSEINRYLPAVRKADDIFHEGEKLEDGLYLADAKEGLSRLPDRSVDLIIADPPLNPIREGVNMGEPKTLSEYYQWNEDWLAESHRILKATGAIYLMCDWKKSGMYHSLISQRFHVQSRITWKILPGDVRTQGRGWNNALADIWFATKSEEFLFHGNMITHSDDEEQQDEVNNFWSDIADKEDSNELNEGISPEIIIRILDASSFKLSWVVDPFSGYGLTGSVAKTMGRRFIGMEIDQDRLLMAMKRIDQT